METSKNHLVGWWWWRGHEAICGECPGPVTCWCVTYKWQCFLLSQTLVGQRTLCPWTGCITSLVAWLCGYECLQLGWVRGQRRQPEHIGFVFVLPTLSCPDIPTLPKVSRSNGRESCRGICCDLEIDVLCFCVSIISKYMNGKNFYQSSGQLISCHIIYAMY